MKTLKFKLKSSTKRQLKEAAANLDISMDELLNNAIDLWLKLDAEESPFYKSNRIKFAPNKDKVKRVKYAKLEEEINV